MNYLIDNDWSCLLIRVSKVIKGMYDPVFWEFPERGLAVVVVPL